jgi:hypothetical protein
VTVIRVPRRRYGDVSTSTTSAFTSFQCFATDRACDPAAWFASAALRPANQLIMPMRVPTIRVYKVPGLSLFPRYDLSAAATEVIRRSPGDCVIGQDT